MYEIFHTCIFIPGFKTGLFLLMFYEEPTRENESDTNYSQLKVFIPVGLDYTHVFRIQVYSQAFRARGY